MFCNRCGQKIDENSVFCCYCGSRIETVPAAAEPEVRVVEDQPDVLITVVQNPSEEQAVTVQQIPVRNSVPLQPVYPPYTPPVLPTAPAKKGSLKVPLLILAGLSVVGLILFLLFPKGAQAPENDIPYLMNMMGNLTFIEAYYNGESELTIPNIVAGQTVTVIDEECFAGCRDLTTVILPDTLESISARAFSDCSRLRGLKIPEGVTYIGVEAFADCRALEAIVIPKSTQVLEHSAFADCVSLRHIYYGGTMEQWDELFQGNLEEGISVYCSDGTISID